LGRNRFQICWAAAKQKFIPAEPKDVCDLLLLNRRTCRTVLLGSLQNHAGPKKKFKKTRETCGEQSSMGGGGGEGGWYLESCITW